MNTFIKTCGPYSQGKTWQSIVKAMPICRDLLGKSILDYRKEFKRQISLGTKLQQRVSDEIGNHISTFPTTSVIVKGGVIRYKHAHTIYQLNTHPEFGSKFKIHPSQYKFGYWGNPKELDQIQDNLKSKNGFIDERGELVNLSADKKSQKFMALGDASWLDALSTSPAEPGLARILPINNRNDLLSAGGWNDLHPTLVLRALGCKNIIYVTRRGGDSMFGQGVIRKLTRMGGFNWKEWEGLSTAEKRQKNAMGDRNDVGEKASSWSKLFNLSNPKSSFSRSLVLSDAVWCTNWDSLNLKQGMDALVNDGFSGLLYNRSDSSFFKESDTLSLEEYESQLLEVSSPRSNPYEFSGCLSNP